MNAQTRWKRAVLVTCLVVVTATAGAAGAAQSPEAEALSLSALAGTDGAVLSIDAPAGVTAFEFVHVEIRAPGELEEDPDRTINVKDVAVRDGVATIPLAEAHRGDSVRVDVHFRESNPPRTAIHRGQTVVKLRPDLAVAAVYAPPQTLSTRAIDVVADLSELNGESGAKATVNLKLGPTPIAEAQAVIVPAGDDVSVTFHDVKLTTAMTAELTVELGGATPFELDTTNNTNATKVEVTEHELVRSNVLLDALGGYGAQFNQHVYASITPKPPGSLPDLESKVIDLEPQLVRIFFHEVQERDPDQLASFYKTVELAQETGATINITYHTAANAKLDPDRYMRDFAVVLETLVKTKGFTNVGWVTIQNEVNTTQVTPEQYNALYRELDDELVTRGLREQIRLMGGDLTENGPANVPHPNHKFWWQYMAENMSDVLDAYSVHIYWNYWDLPRMEFRLRSVREIVDGPLVAGARKPLYVTEFGVRGIQNFPGKLAIQPGYWADGTPLSRTNIAAFQHLWFDIASAQLGYSGTVKWDAYWGRYTPGYRETYNLIGPADEGWPLFPAYHALKLLFQTTARGWQVVRVDPWADDDWKLDDAGDPFDQPEKELAAYVGADGQDDQLTVIGLDSHGRVLNAVSVDPPAQYSIGGLPPNTTLNLALWNVSGNGENSFAGTIQTGPAGVARFEVPLHAAFALTTVPVWYRGPGGGRCPRPAGGPQRRLAQLR
jgi:hypothetical protein